MRPWGSSTQSSFSTCGAGGLPDARARNLLTYAFGAEVIERIPVPTLVARLERAVLEHTGAEL